MIVRLDPSSSASVVDQVVAQVVAAIDTGDLDAGSSLPTIRALARDLGVAPGTIARAYAALEGDGWIVTRGRRGTVVAPVPTRRRDAEVAAAARVLARAVRSARLDVAAAHRAVDVAFARLDLDR